MAAAEPMSSALALVGDNVCARAAVWRRAVWAASAAGGDGEGDGCSARSNESNTTDEAAGEAKFESAVTRAEGAGEAK